VIISSLFADVIHVIIITRKYAAIEFLISRASKQENKVFYNQLLQNKKKNIEDNFGGSLSWEELPDNKASRVRVIIEDVNFYNNEDWSQMSKFLVENLPKFERAFIPFVEKIKF
jgi:hypothetical protein